MRSLLTDFELGWVAGLLEGEGSFFLARNKERGTLKSRISMQSTDKDVLERLHVTTGVGILYAVGEREGKKPCWGWNLDRRADLVELANLLRPHMSIRRGEQIDIMLRDATPITRIVKPYRRRSSVAVDV